MEPAAAKAMAAREIISLSGLIRRPDMRGILRRYLASQKVRLAKGG